MKLRCIKKCQVQGYGIVKPGAIIDLNTALIDNRIKACFDPEDVEAPTLQAGGAQLTREQIKAKLHELKVPFRARDTHEQLMQLLASAQEGELEV